MVWGNHIKMRNETSASDRGANGDEDNIAGDCLVGCLRFTRHSSHDQTMPGKAIGKENLKVDVR